MTIMTRFKERKILKVTVPWGPVGHRKLSNGLVTGLTEGKKMETGTDKIFGRKM